MFCLGLFCHLKIRITEHNSFINYCLEALYICDKKIRLKFYIILILKYLLLQLSQNTILFSIKGKRMFLNNYATYVKIADYFYTFTVKLGPLVNCHQFILSLGEVYSNVCNYSNAN